MRDAFVANPRDPRRRRTRLTLAPGQNGTKKLVEKYGSRLVCVRFRYDEQRQRRYKTIELIVEDAPWVPPGAIHYLRVAFSETIDNIP